MYSILDPDLELVGIVTSYGNVTKEQATATAAYLLKLGGANGIPIIPGASKPVQEEGPPPIYPEIHGRDGLGPIEIPPNFQYQQITYPFDTIRVLIERYKDELIIVDTGRSTSLAIAFILFPEYMKMVHSFYIMGGALFMPGNASALAEANFHGDPTASNIIVKTAHNLTITPLNVTQHAILTRDMVEAISKNKHNAFASLMMPIFDFYYNFYKKREPSLQGAPIHDLLTMMVVKNPTIVDYINYDATVVEDDEEVKGMFYIDYRPNSKKGKTKIAVNLHYEEFIKEFNRVMLRE
ncbi:nucleoside hydrolase [Ureibacillus sp. NPDC094379]